MSISDDHGDVHMMAAMIYILTQERDMIKCLSWFNSKFQVRKTKKNHIFGEGKTLTDPNEGVEEPDKKCCKYIHSV